MSHQSTRTSHNAAGFLPTDSASDLPSLLGDLADDAETDIEPFDGPDDAEDEMDTDLEELLAWGSGEIELEGMPGANPLHGHAMWYEDEPEFFGFEIATDADSDFDDSDDSFDSTEEAEQLLAIKSGFASDSEGSIGDGDTTDSLDDTDHDALVRFGIEEAEPQPEQSTTKRKNSKKRRRSSGSEHPPAQRLVKSQEPVLGQFLPRPEIASAAILITNERAQIISPYSIKKIRKLIPQPSSTERSRRGSEASSSYASSATATSAPALNLPTLVVPEEPEEIYMELDLGDILDASALEADEDLGMMLRQPEETDGEGGNDAAEAAFERWARIPISAFRRARQEDMSAVEEALSPEKAVRRGSNGDEVYLPFSSAIFTSEGSLAALDLRSPHQKKGKRRKISRKDAIALSPMLCPVQTSRAPSPNNIRSRKERRADKKKDRKTKSSTSQNARSSRSPAKADGSTAAEMLMPPSSTVLSHDPMSSSLSTSMGMGLAPVSPAPFNTFHDTEVPPLDLPASLVDFA